MNCRDLDSLAERLRSNKPPIPPEDLPYLQVAMLAEIASALNAILQELPGTGRGF